MSNRTEILNQYLNDPQYRQICNIFNDEDFERYVPLYLIIGYIMNQPDGDKPKNLYTNILRRPTAILNQLRPYLIASDLNINAIIECIRHIDRTETKRILKVGFTTIQITTKQQPTTMALEGKPYDKHSNLF